MFYDEGAGYTEDGNNGIGLPFACVQKDNKVVFSFGGAEKESRQELVVKTAGNGIVTGELDEDGIVEKLYDYTLCIGKKIQKINLTRSFRDVMFRLRTINT